MNKHERRAAKRLLKGVFTGLLIGVIAYAPGTAFAYRSSKQAQQRDTQNLRNYQRNLDTLSDKDNNLSDLIESLHRSRVFYTSGTTAGGNVLLPEIGTDDVIIEVTAFSSSTLVQASTQTTPAAAPDGSLGADLKFISNLWGEAGNKVSIRFHQQSDTNTLGALTINTTGYLVEIRLGTGTVAAHRSSGTFVCATWNADPDASRLATCQTVTFATAVVTVPAINPWVMAGGTSGNTGPHQHDVTDWFTMTSSAVATAGTSYPATSVDGLKFRILDKPEE